jgi:EAL domain-containing protein (putative c-di-GMP-specific phosphodiesterase class I)
VHRAGSYGSGEDQRGLAGSLDDEMDDAARDQPDAWRQSLVAELRGAIEADGLTVAYQPKADLGSRQIVGVQALVRWDHPRYGSLPPDDFIPLAEHTGLIRPLTDLVLNRTLRQWRAWCDLGIELSVAVNVSTLSLLDDDLAGTMAEALERTGMPPRLLTLEISDLVGLDQARALETMHDLRKIGIRLSIDGFDGGVPTMSHLAELPVQEVTIDKSFVLIMTVDEDAATIVQRIIGLAANLRLTAVAKGVEDAASLSLLTELGCDMVQGYYLSRPVAASVLTAAVVEKGTELSSWMPA